MSASAGRVLIIPKGDYNSATTYNMLDMVYFGGKSYICKQTSTGNDPTNTVYWQIMLDGASEFSELTDVNITDPQNGDGIAYNATSHKWENTTPVGITITSPPATIDYTEGEILDLTGMVVMAEYSTGQTRNITTECTFTPANGATLRASNTSVTVTWREFDAEQEINVTALIYGVEWSGTSSPIFTRTDASTNFVDPVPAVNNGNGSSPFDDIFPWAGIERVEDPDVGTLVKIPKFYYKLSAQVLWKLQISSSPFEGSSVSPAHMDRGDGQGERDFVYVGAYHCATGTYKSTTGVNPQNNNAYSTFKDNIHNLGSDIWLWDKQMLETIQMLYLVEYAHWNSQEKIGMGGSANEALYQNGLTDLMTYHTGTDATSRTEYGATRYRYIENLWGDVRDVLNGIYYLNNRTYVFNDISQSALSGGTDVGFVTSMSNYAPIVGMVKSSASGIEWCYMPNTAGNTANFTEYMCDQAVISHSYNEAYDAHIFSVGCSYVKSESFGLFFMMTSTSSKNAQIGARLMKLPSA